MLKTLIGLATFCCTSLVLFGQTDFNNYTTLLSRGSLPRDFSEDTYVKVEEEIRKGREGMSHYRHKEFLERTNYAIDELLHSGYITFGDDVSEYVEDVADKLLRGKRELRSELRFYTLKSNATNAFSTDQGIIFVTTGLVSQLSNEAQLAYILAHEICHYTEEHVLESFTWSKRNDSKRGWISKMSIYSKEREFEADKLALDLYKKAGYSKDELVSTFDVLKYSYLPFDEIEVPQSYFSTDRMYIPPSQFPTKKYEIKAEEDEDDSESSHPNIKRRKEAVLEAVKSISNWKDGVFQLGEERFQRIRNIARFEGVRAHILDAEYGDAVYSIFLLEQEFPNSIYLQRLKAQSWLGLYQYEKKHRISVTIDKSSKYEGESAMVHFLIRKFNEKSMAAIALRQVTDIRSAHPDDEEINAIYKHLIYELAWSKRFDLDLYAKVDFHTAAQEYLKTQNPPDQDSTKVEKPKKGSKYDRIKKITNADSPDNFDTTKYYVYAIPDIVTDPSFLDLFNSQRAAYEDEQRREKAFEKLSVREKIKHYKERRYNDLHIGANELISVEPKVYSYNSRGIDLVRSEKVEQRFASALDYAATEAGVSLYPVDSRSIQRNGVQGFNERSTLISLLHQVANEDDIRTFPIDYGLLKGISNNYGSADVLFTMVEHSYSPEISWGYLLYSVLLPPVFVIVASIHVPVAIIQGNSTVMSFLVLEPNTGSVKVADRHFFNEPVRKHHLGAHIYDILVNIKTPE